MHAFQWRGSELERIIGIRHDLGAPAFLFAKATDTSLGVAVGIGYLHAKVAGVLSWMRRRPLAKDAHDIAKMMCEAHREQHEHESWVSASP
jgi:hypothetical protein